MKIEGSFSFENARPEAVWAALTGPDSIAACLPGCEGLEAVAENSYRMTMRVGIGPIKSTYAGTVDLLELQPPSSLNMKVSGSGGAGFVNGTGSLVLEAEGDGSRVRYEGDVAVGGRIASLGGRMVGGAARMVIEQFFKRLAEWM